MRKILVLAAMTCVVCEPTIVKAQTMLAAALVKPAFVNEIAAPEEQVKDQLLAGTEKFAAGAKEVTEVNMDKNTLGMMSGKGRDSDMPGKMEWMVVHSYEYDKPGMYRMEDFEAISKRLRDGSWNCSIHVKEKDGSTDICSRSANGETSEMVIMTAEPRELTFVHMKGRGLTLGDLSKAGGARRALPVPPAPPARAPRPGAAPAAPAAPPAPAAPAPMP